MGDQHSSPNVAFSKQALSRKLLICAILFEVIAVTAGLALAGASLYEAIEAAPDRTPGLLINAGLGTIPFVLVAITEGAKIPLSFFNVSSGFWKAIVALTLLASAVITFETAATGFERAFTVRANEVETLLSTSLPKPIGGLPKSRTKTPPSPNAAPSLSRS